MPDCGHLTIQTYTDAVTGEAHIWACADCKRRFYPACETCVSIGHRNEVHTPVPLDAVETERMAAAMNDAQIEADEVALGRDLRVPARRILAALHGGTRG
jgi:hypothetical protein